MGRLAAGRVPDLRLATAWIKGVEEQVTLVSGGGWRGLPTRPTGGTA
ncbi:hypothetical protein [Salinispora arenicola]|nr:hypothetical protein [Salinispora arenicola]